MISGLRFDGSCVQDNLKLNPSITTFGKCLGGGLPIGIIAIKKNIEINIRKKKLKIFFLEEHSQEIQLIHLLVIKFQSI